VTSVCWAMKGEPGGTARHSGLPCYCPAVLHSCPSSYGWFRVICSQGAVSRHVRTLAGIGKLYVSPQNLSVCIQSLLMQEYFFQFWC